MSALSSRRARPVLAVVTVGMTLLAGCARPAPVETAVAPAALMHSAARDAGALAASIAERASAPDKAGAAAPPAASDSNMEALAPGLYGLERLADESSGSTVTIRSQRPCSDVLDELRAGQWTMTFLPASQTALGMTIAVMSYGDRLAVVYLKDQDASCFGSLTVAEPADIEAGGALTASASGIELPVYCHVGPNVDGQDLNDLAVGYFGMFVTDKGAFMVNLSGPANKGTSRLTMGEEGDQGIMVLPVKPGMDPADAALKFVGSFYSGTGDVDSAFSQFTGMFSGEGTLTVTSTDPWRATLTTDALAAYDEDADDDDYSDDEESDESAAGAGPGTAGATLTLTTTVHCDL